MRKDNPKIVGEIDCQNPACDEIASVRQRSNGRNLYYTYCEHCKSLNQTGDDAFQDYVAENMREVGTGKPEQPAADAVSEPESEPNGETEQPESDTETQTEPEPEQEPEPLAARTESGAENENKSEPELWRPSSKPAAKTAAEPEKTESEKGGLTGWHIFGLVALVIMVGAGGYFAFKRLSRKAEPQPQGA
ncbi:hypothetical protein HMF8227_01447 [Saliniradius amylolyticus]|uniref:Uncharacterized protein n=1 Tax=Saliniradius amylolyticus TaxID=2183582 RepID=A0A2S2E325_9ALTE|nr:hypothetical protein [Saliniradius amylolyticus]AWL11922.1 hypothetical protein HMF8227_01447 [Saliniradius amylolyticus]